jgi:Fe-S cluster biosynthesis and repair protein YggX
MLINEKQLSMMDPEARKYISAQMDNYFAGASYDKAEGFVAPEE